MNYFVSTGIMRVRFFLLLNFATTLILFSSCFAGEVKLNKNLVDVSGSIKMGSSVLIEEVARMNPENWKLSSEHLLLPELRTNNTSSMLTVSGLSDKKRLPKSTSSGLDRSGKSCLTATTAERSSATCATAETQDFDTKFITSVMLPIMQWSTYIMVLSVPVVLIVLAVVALYRLGYEVRILMSQWREVKGAKHGWLKNKLRRFVIDAVAEDFERHGRTRIAFDTREIETEKVESAGV